MSAATITQAQDKGLRHHFEDLLGAVRNFSVALYAAWGGWPTAPAKPATAAVKQQSRTRMMSLANDAEQHSPSLSAELRNLASRG